MKKKSNGGLPDQDEELDIPPVTKASMPRGAMGKYYRQVMSGSNLVRIAPDLNEWFPNEGSVNKAIRELLALRNVLATIMEPKPGRKRRKTA